MLKSSLPLAVSSLSQYTEWVETVMNEWTDDSGIETPWFRGVGDTEYKLFPGLYRSDAGRAPLADDELRTEFNRKALPFVSGHAPRDEWEWYFLMQHYRAPTRLLDWTDAALVALYFALTAWRPSVALDVPSAKPAVWVLNPFTLNSKVPFFGPLNTDFEEATPYLPERYSGQRLPKYPIAIDPPFIAQRMLVQHSHFTIHGSDMRSLDQMRKDLRLEDSLLKVTIDADPEDLRYLQHHLAILGITETAIFPDLEGLAKELRIEYQIDKHW